MLPISREECRWYQEVLSSLRTMFPYIPQARSSCALFIREYSSCAVKYHKDCGRLSLVWEAWSDCDDKTIKEQLQVAARVHFKHALFLTSYKIALEIFAYNGDSSALPELLKFSHAYFVDPIFHARLNELKWQWRVLGNRDAHAVLKEVGGRLFEFGKLPKPHTSLVMALYKEARQQLKEFVKKIDLGGNPCTNPVRHQSSGMI